MSTFHSYLLQPTFWRTGTQPFGANLLENREHIIWIVLTEIPCGVSHEFSNCLHETAGYLMVEEVVRDGSWSTTTWQKESQKSIVLLMSFIMA